MNRYNPTQSKASLRFLTTLLVALSVVVFSNDTAQAFESGKVNKDPSSHLYTYRAIITSVYDGDTVTADIDLGMKIWLRGERLRLWGIDTPEINRGNNRAAGRAARDFLAGIILNRQVIVKTIRDRKGKYGRYLAIIYKGNTNINELLVSKSFARRYMVRR